VPEDLPPPVVPEAPSVAADDEGLEATGLMEPVKPAAEPELDPRALKALSRQERKEAKAALRREQQEARNAARQAKALAKASAKAGQVQPTTATAASAAADEDVTEEISEDVAPAASGEGGTTDVEVPASDEASAPTDPRARAAQRVQRRLGKDAEKLSAAEARARAREEARRRRAQAKEQKSGVVAEEAVVRPPEEPTERDLAEDVSVVEPVAEQVIEAEPLVAEQADEPQPAEEPVEEAPLVEEPVIEEPVIEEPVIEEPVIDEVIEEAELPKPVIGQRIDEPAPVEDVEPAVVEEAELEPELEPEPEPIAESKPIVTTREVYKSTPAAVPADGDKEPKGGSPLAPIAGVVGLIALGISVLLAVGALLVALGLDSGGLYEGLRTVANLLVGPLEGAFDFSGANAERKEHFLAWGAGSIGYLLISFVGQAVQRANDEE